MGFCMLNQNVRTGNCLLFAFASELQLAVIEILRSMTITYRLYELWCIILATTIYTLTPLPPEDILTLTQSSYLGRATVRQAMSLFKGFWVAPLRRVPQYGPNIRPCIPQRNVQRSPKIQGCNPKGTTENPSNSVTSCCLAHRLACIVVQRLCIASLHGPIPNMERSVGQTSEVDRQCCTVCVLQLFVSTADCK